MNEIDYRESLAREAKRLKVYMTHHYTDPEFMPTLSYRVDSKIAMLEQRIVELKRLQDRYSA